VALLVDGLVTSAMFLGASLMLCFKVPPAPFFDLSIPGVLGFFSSLFLVWRVFRATKKARN
jgi:hypothetical protein